jgi:hypothetical protein
MREICTARQTRSTRFWGLRELDRNHLLAIKPELMHESVLEIDFPASNVKFGEQWMKGRFSAPKSATEERSGEYKTLIEKGQFLNWVREFRGLAPKSVLGLAPQFHRPW